MEDNPEADIAAKRISDTAHLFDNDDDEITEISNSDHHGAHEISSPATSQHDIYSVTPPSIAAPVGYERGIAALAVDQTRTFENNVRNYDSMEPKIYASGVTESPSPTLSTNSNAIGNDESVGSILGKRKRPLEYDSSEKSDVRPYKISKPSLANGDGTEITSQDGGHNMTLPISTSNQSLENLSPQPHTLPTTLMEEPIKLDENDKQPQFDASYNAPATISSPLQDATNLASNQPTPHISPQGEGRNTTSPLSRPNQSFESLSPQSYARQTAPVAMPMKPDENELVENAMQSQLDTPESGPDTMSAPVRTATNLEAAQATPAVSSQGSAPNMTSPTSPLNQILENHLPTEANEMAAAETKLSRDNDMDYEVNNPNIKVEPDLPKQDMPLFTANTSGYSQPFTFVPKAEQTMVVNPYAVSDTATTVAIFPDPESKPTDGTTRYLTDDMHRYRYGRPAPLEALNSSQTLIKGLDDTIVTKAEHLDRLLNTPSRIPGKTSSQIAQDEFGKMKLDVNKVDRKVKPLADYPAMARFDNSYIAFDPNKSQRRTLKEALQASDKLWLQDKDGKLVTTEAFDKRHGRNAAAIEYGKLSAVAFEERRSDIPIAMYRAGVKGKEYVSHEEYERQRTGDKPPLGMHKDKSAREVLLQSPDGKSVLSPKDYKKYESDSYLATMNAAGLDLAMGDRSPAADSSRPIKLVSHDGKLIEAKSFIRETGSKPDKDDVFSQEVFNGTARGSFHDRQKFRSLAELRGITKAPSARTLKPNVLNNNIHQKVSKLSSSGGIRKIQSDSPGKAKAPGYQAKTPAKPTSKPKQAIDNVNVNISNIARDANSARQGVLYDNRARSQSLSR